MEKLRATHNRYLRCITLRVWPGNRRVFFVFFLRRFFEVRDDSPDEKKAT